MENPKLKLEPFLGITEHSNKGDSLLCLKKRVQLVIRYIQIYCWTFEDFEGNMKL